MALVNLRDMLNHAYCNGYAVGAFDLVSLDFLEGIMSAAERCRAPVILSLAESHFDYFDFDLLMPAVETAARRASVPVAIHLDHGANMESAVYAINLGCNGVMVDASHLPFDENLEVSRQVLEMATPAGVGVEAELGEIVGVEEEIVVAEEDAHLADPDKAEIFCRTLDLGVFAPAIRPPTVPEGSARLRFSVMATHTGEDLSRVNRLLDRLLPSTEEPV